MVAPCGLDEVIYGIVRHVKYNETELFWRIRIRKVDVFHSPGSPGGAVIVTPSFRQGVRFHRLTMGLPMTAAFGRRTTWRMY